MIDDAQYEYLIKFFDAGSLDRLKREMKSAEQAVDRLSKKAEGLQAITSSLGFGANPKGELAANGVIRTGGAQAAASNSLTQGRLARRQAQIAEQVIRLDEDNHRRLKKHYTALQRQQATELASLSRQDFLNREVTSLKEAQVKAEAAKLRTAIASREFLNNTDGRSAGRLSRQLNDAQTDERAAVANAERLNNLARENEVLGNRRQAIQTKMETSQARMNAQVSVGNTKEAQREALKFRQLQLDQKALIQHRFTTAEMQKHVAAQNRLNAAKAKFNAQDAGGRSRNAGELFKIQAQLLANYAAMGLALSTLAYAGRFVVQLDGQFAQLQAITATTDEAMGGLKDTIIGVSEVTKFTALEVAEAATVLGQAGFSTDEIESSIQSITLLATAVGSDLTTAVDLVTSTLSVFNLRAEEAENVANVFTSAVNNSKLNLEKLTLGLQYSGNIANEQNISFSELTATLGAMANSGIRAGSTLGTGLRQILTALAAPSEKLQARLTDLGLTLEDVDVKLHGFTGVLDNLQNAGFTTSDALEVLEVRAGAAFAALANNSGTIDELRGRFLLSTAAAKANEVQMESLGNKGARLASVFGTVAYNGLGPMIEASKVAVDTLAFLLGMLNNLGPVLPILTTAIVGLGIAMAGKAAAVTLAQTGLVKYIATMVTTRVTAAATATTMKGMALALGPVGLALIGITTAGIALSAAFDGMTVSADELKAKLDESAGKMDTYKQNIIAIDKEIERLTKRHFDASVSMQEVNNIALELQHKFADLGARFDFTTGSIEKLVPELERLRDVMYELQEVELEGSLLDSENLLEKEQKLLRRQFYSGTTSLNPFNRNSSVSVENDPIIKSFIETLAEGNPNVSDPEAFKKYAQELRNFNQYLTGEKSGVIDRLRQGNANGDFGELEEFRLTKRRAALDGLQKQVEGMLAKTSDIETKRAALAQLQFERENSNFSKLSIGLQIDKDRFTEFRANNDKEGAAAFLAEIEGSYSGARDQFSGDELGHFDATSFNKDYEGLRHTVSQFLKMTETQIREEDELHRHRMDAAQAEIDNMLRGEKVSQAAVNRRISREEIFKALDNKQAEERKHLVDQMKRDNVSERIQNARLEALGREEAAERQKIVDAFEASDLAKSVETRDQAFKALEASLQSEISLEKKRVNTRTSVAEIEAAKARALEAQTELEIAAREQLRFDLRHEAHRLDYEMEQLNNQLADDREALGLSFDNLHKPLKDTHVPAIKDSLGKLTQSFDRARTAFDEKVRMLQDPVNQAQAARDAMDAPANAGQFSDVHRRQMDRKVQEAEIEALRAELNLFKEQRSVELQSQSMELDAEKVRIEQRMTQLEQVLANYNGGDNSTSQVDAKAAQAELNALRTQQRNVDGEISDKKKEIAETTARILELERELGIQTGASAPQRYTWLESLTNGLSDYMKKLEDAIINSENFADKIEEVGDVLTDSLGDALYDMATGAKSFGEAMGDMAKEVIKAVLKIIAQQLALMAVTMLMRALGVPVIGFSTGGQVGSSGGQATKLPTFAVGGEVPSLGIVGRDAVPIMAQAGEFVMRNSAVESIGRDKLYEMNAMGSAALDKRELTAIAVPDTGSKEVNVYVVAPDEKPQLGPDDILHVIGQDLATGGQTKQLIKHVMMN